MPKHFEEGILYISIAYCTASHKCPCGCGNRIVTPFTPINWKLIFDGDSVSLEPSIGNWSYPCESHYWIRNNEVIWANKWSRKKIDKSREEKQVREDDYFQNSL